MSEEGVSEARITRVGALSLANTLGVLYVFSGFIVGLFLFLFTLVVGAFTSSLSTALSLTGFSRFVSLGAFTYLVGFPLVYGVLGWITGLIGGLFYNLASLITKGIKLYSN